jgi:uncharacterized peroxidase-related enzyme
MNRIPQLEPEQAAGKSKQLFDQVQSSLGSVPNLFRVLGIAPAALEGYLSFSAALARGSLTARVREQIALAVAESNLCGYCVSAHAFTGARVGLTEKDIVDARRARAAARKPDAILKLARNIVVQRGEVSDADLQQARASDITNGEVIEIVANVAANIFTNYVNHVARTVVDFPDVKPNQLEAPRDP